MVVNNMHLTDAFDVVLSSTLRPCTLAVSQLRYIDLSEHWIYQQGHLHVQPGFILNLQNYDCACYAQGFNQL